MCGRFRLAMSSRVRCNGRVGRSGIGALTHHLRAGPKAAPASMTYSPEFRSAAVAAVRLAVRERGCSLGALSRAFEVSHSTLLRWCREEGVKLPAPRDRMSKSWLHGGRWGDVARRRARAREMRAAGASLAEICAACGYRHESGAYYAVMSSA
jgi:transposase-like protein